MTNREDITETNTDIDGMSTLPLDHWRTTRPSMRRPQAILGEERRMYMAGIHRERPGAADLQAATGEPAVALGDDVWMSPGVSNAYAVATDDGRVVINGGIFFEGPLRHKAFEDVPGPTRAIVVTQGQVIIGAGCTRSARLTPM